MESRGVSLTRCYSCRGPMRSVPHRGSGWVRTSRAAHRLPTRYRDVVLTSWDRGMNDGESEPSAYRVVVVTSWDRGSSQGSETCATPLIGVGETEGAARIHLGVQGSQPPKGSRTTKLW